MSKINRTVLHHEVPTVQDFVTGGVVRTKNDIFRDTSNALWFYIGSTFPYYVPSGSTPENSKDVWSLAQKVESPVVVPTVGGLHELEPEEGTTVSVGGTQGGMFIAVVSDTLVPDGGTVFESGTSGTVWKRVGEEPSTTHYGLTADSTNTAEVLNKAFKNIKSIKLDSDLHFHNSVELVDGLSIDLQGNTIFGHANVFEGANSKDVSISNGKFVSDGNPRFLWGVTKGITVSRIHFTKGALAITFVGTYSNRNENILVQDCVHDGRTQSSVLGGFFSVDYGNNIVVTRCTGLGGSEFIDLNNFCTNCIISYNSITGVYRENIFDVNSSQNVHIHNNYIDQPSVMSGARAVWISSYSGPAYPPEASEWFRHSDSIIIENNTFKFKGAFPSDYCIVINSGTGAVPVPDGRYLEFTFKNNRVISSDTTRVPFLFGVPSKYNIVFSENTLHNVVCTLQGNKLMGYGNTFSQSTTEVGTCLIVRGFTGTLSNSVFSKYSPTSNNNQTTGVIQLVDCPDITLLDCKFKEAVKGYAYVSGIGNTKPKVLDYSYDTQPEQVVGIRLSSDAILRKL